MPPQMGIGQINEFGDSYTKPAAVIDDVQGSVALAGLGRVAAGQAQPFGPVGVEGGGSEIDGVPAGFRFLAGNADKGKTRTAGTALAVAGVAALGLEPGLDRCAYFVSPVRQGTPPGTRTQATTDSNRSTTHRYRMLSMLRRMT
ncbi:hypothetical protein Ate02nite_61440 [Paractinoplanes tereljensis]|uniref:Uncharacterized protein n=1 Tax=Paractinoplanes tereljensis TaxID=571912 RepID=A0A919NT09_9ACTN|nr:hypothetical protein Ate02nite_61440 [Actinoplanes tereljensis]